MPTNVTRDIELHFGYEDSQGQMHKTATMRPLNGQDIIEIQRDKGLQELMSDDIVLDEQKPISLMLAALHLMPMRYLLLAKVVTSIGTLTGDQITPEVFRTMPVRDTNILMKAYSELNGMDSDDIGFFGNAGLQRM